MKVKTIDEGNKGLKLVAKSNADLVEQLEYLYEKDPEYCNEMIGNILRLRDNDYDVKANPERWSFHVNGLTDDNEKADGSIYIDHDKITVLPKSGEKDYFIGTIGALASMLPMAMKAYKNFTDKPGDKVKLPPKTQSLGTKIAQVVDKKANDVGLATLMKMPFEKVVKKLKEYMASHDFDGKGIISDVMDLIGGEKNDREKMDDK